MLLFHCSDYIYVRIPNIIVGGNRTIPASVYTEKKVLGAWAYLGYSKQMIDYQS